MDIQTVGFKLPFEPYFTGPIPFGHDERVVEVPWVMHNIVGNRVLDVGCAYAEPGYYERLKSLNIKELCGFDMAIEFDDRRKQYQSLYKYTSGDLCKFLPYEKDFFDTIICLSTIEHVGCNNNWYWNDGVHLRRDSDDKIALNNMLLVLKPNGRLLLTVPYGMEHNIPEFREYTRDTLLQMIGDAKILDQQYFFYNGIGWIESDEHIWSKSYYGHFGFISAQAIACIILTK